MAIYLNPHENLEELGLENEALFSKWQLFDEKIINSFSDEVSLLNKLLIK